MPRSYKQAFCKALCECSSFRYLIQETFDEYRRKDYFSELDGRALRANIYRELNAERIAHGTGLSWPDDLLHAVADNIMANMKDGSIVGIIEANKP